MLLALCTNRSPLLHFSHSPCLLPASLFSLPRGFHARGCICSAACRRRGRERKPLSPPRSRHGQGQEAAASSPRRRSRMGSAPQTAPHAPGRWGFSTEDSSAGPGAGCVQSPPMPLSPPYSSDLSDHPPETPSPACPVGREHLWTPPSQSTELSLTHCPL